MKIFPVYYFPPIAWFTAALAAGEIVLERHEFYRKQNYFNRMRIQTANKVLKLTVPIVKAKEHTPLTQREISFAERWEHDQWVSITSAYRASPYFEYYEDRLRPLFSEPKSNLFDQNLATIDFILEALNLDISYTTTDKFMPTEHYEIDYRKDFSARNPSMPDWFEPAEYPQVFGEEFQPNLSMLDLMFNKGPASELILRESWKG